MAGLLDDFKMPGMDTPQGQGLLAAAFSLMNAKGPSLGNAIGQAGGQYMGTYNQSRDADAQRKYRDMQQQQMQMQMEAAKRKQEQDARISAGMGQFFKPGQAALSPLMGDASTGILPSAGREAVAPSFDAGGAAQFLAQQGEYEKALPMLQSLNKQSEYSPEVRYDQTGRAFMTAKDGSVKFLDGIKARDKLEDVRLGDKVGFRSPYSTEMQGSMPIGQSPDSRAGNAITMRGQNMADARARDRLSFDQNGGTDGYSTKPLPTAALKMQNDAIDAIGTAGGINQMLAGVEKQITDKKVKFGPVSNLVNQGLNAAGMSSEESRNFSSFKSNLEKIRNESLRLNSGVQTDGDAQRAWNELFQNINDTALVKQRLGEIKTLNDRAVDLQKLKVDGIRGNYKAAPYDYGKLPASGGASGGWSITKE